ncbi:hypothetical protein D3C79_847610 [compost metagenome]
MPHHATVTDHAVEQHAVEADEHSIANGAGPMNDRAVGDGTEFADGHRRTGFGVDHHAVLDVRVGADGDRLHVARVIDFVSTYHRVGADEHVLPDHHFAADDCRLVDVGRFGNQR